MPESGAEFRGYKPLVATLSAIVAIEVLSEESITHCYQRMLEHPKLRYVAMGTLAVGASHLLGLLPRSVDPFYLHERWSRGE